MAIDKKTTCPGSNRQVNIGVLGLQCLDLAVHACSTGIEGDVGDDFETGFLGSRFAFVRCMLAIQGLPHGIQRPKEIFCER